MQRFEKVEKTLRESIDYTLSYQWKETRNIINKAIAKVTRPLQMKELFYANIDGDNHEIYGNNKLEMGIDEAVSEHPSKEDAASGRVSRASKAGSNKAPSGLAGSIKAGSGAAGSGDKPPASQKLPSQKLTGSQRQKSQLSNPENKSVSNKTAPSFKAPNVISLEY